LIISIEVMTCIGENNRVVGLLEDSQF